MHGFLENEREARDPVIQHGAAHLEGRFVEQQAVAQHNCIAVAAHEAFARIERGAAKTGAVGRDLAGVDRQVDAVVLDEVPCVGGESVFDAINETRWPEQLERTKAAEADAQQPIEPDEMVHVGVRHEDVTRAQHFARRQCVDVTQVEEQGAAIEQHVYVQGRVGERPIDETRLENRTHADGLHRILETLGASAHP